jgi:anti-anti-sigma regulatory factor
MALFSKLPARKPGMPRAAGGGRGGVAPLDPRAKGAEAAHNKTAGGITITGFGLVEPSPTRRIIEVTHGNAGMCAVLENAVLLFASGHADAARTLLADGIESDDEAKESPLAWLSLFDLLQRAGDRQAFEQLALKYVVQFERSAPTWDDRVRPAAAGARPSGGGYVSVTGKLTAATSAQLEPLRNAIAKNTSQARFDLAAITGFDDAGARLLADVLADARRRQYPLRLQRPDALRRALNAAVKRGRAGGEGAWLLWLELLQWQNDSAAFDDGAVDYAVTFEVSPPSWEPPALATAPAEARSDAAGAANPSGEALADGTIEGGDMLAWSGVVSGAHPEQLARLSEFADGRQTIPVSMAEVERVDFVAAGSIYNAVKTLEEHGKTVQVFGATPIVRAMLLLIGIAPGHFFKKA